MFKIFSSYAHYFITYCISIHSNNQRLDAMLPSEEKEKTDLNYCKCIIEVGIIGLLGISILTLNYSLSQLINLQLWKSFLEAN